MSDEPSQLPPAPNGTSSVDPESIEGLFITALAKNDPTEREEFLSEVCAGDAEKRQRVDALLRAYDDAGSFFEKPPLAGATVTQTLDFDFLEPSDDPSLLGKLGPYEIYEMIGRGGMGIVFRARDPKLNRVVAVKVLAPELAVNPNAKRRFVREAQAGAAISHPHVVTIHAVDEEEKLPFLVMECIVGQSLQEKLDKVGSLRLIEVLRISKQIAEGLSAAHHQGLIHRDIKPANILLENGVERVKITDFGLARAIDDVSVTRTGEVAGSPQFMSPEQALGERVDHRSDLFSLGCVMYAMCAGRSPFRATSIAASIRRVCDDEPRPLVEINPEVPGWMIAIIQKLLQKNPDERFQTAGELMQTLEARLAGHGYAGVVPENATTTDLEKPSKRAEDSKQPVAPILGVGTPILEMLSSSFLRFALLGPLITLLCFSIWAMMPQAVDSHQVSYILMGIGPVLWGAALVGWLGSHVDHVEWGNEAYYKGRIASVLAFVTPPLWNVGIPTAFVAFWTLRQPKVLELYEKRDSDRKVSLAVPGYLLDLGVLLGTVVMSFAALLIINDHRFTIIDLLEAAPLVLGVSVLVFPLRGALYRGRFWRDITLASAAFSIVSTGFWLFHPGGSRVGIHTPVETVIALMFLGIVIGLPAFAIWNLLSKSWLAYRTSVSDQEKQSLSRNMRGLLGIGLLLLVAVIQLNSRMTSTPVPRRTSNTPAVERAGQIPTASDEAAEPVPREVVLAWESFTVDVNQLIGTWIVKGTEKTDVPETITIETVVIDPSPDTGMSGMYDPGLQLTFTDVGGNLQTGHLSVNSSLDKFTLVISEDNRVVREWHGKFELFGNHDNLRLEFDAIMVHGGEPPPRDFSEIGKRDYAPRQMNASYQRQNTDSISDGAGASTE